jgi:hypothetical protein
MGIAELEPRQWESPSKTKRRDYIPAQTLSMKL